MEPTLFDDRVRQSLKQHGLKDRTGNELVEWWKNFVEQCEDGYGWTIYEYDDEISVRDSLDAVLNDRSVMELPNADELLKQVERIDERFKALLQIGVSRPMTSSKWWRTGVLKFAGEEYRSDMESRYSIRVNSSG
jgi:hypothetical protein